MGNIKKECKVIYSGPIICSGEKFIYELSPEILHDIWNFANSINSISHYAKTRNTTQNKSIRDQFVGKCGEYGAAWYLYEEHKLPLVLPDFEQYEVKNKSWNADLDFNNKHIHVKSHAKYQDNYLNNLCSWTFQYKEPTDKLFNSGGENDYVLLTQVKYDKLDRSYGTNTVTIYALLPWLVAKTLLRDPQKKEHIGRKKCLYWEDIVDYGKTNAL